MAGILVSKLDAEAHASAAGQENKLSSVPAAGRKIMGHAPFCKSAETVTAPFAQAAGAVDAPPLTKLLEPWMRLLCCPAGAVGLYHVHPCSSSCFPAPQRAFVGEMGQKRRLVAASSYVFEKGRNFSKQVGR